MHFLLGSWFFFLSSFANAFEAQSLHPEGLIRSPRQARVVFNEPMVPFGDPRAADPFEIKCSVPGKGIWEDSRTWIYEFETELSSGESCEFQGKKDFKAQSGSSWQGKNSFSFQTGGPAIRNSRPYEGSTVEQKPAFLLSLDGDLNTDSVDKNVYILVEGLAERIPVKVLSEKIRDQMAGSGGFDPEFEGAEMDLSPDQKNRKKKNIRIAIESSRLLPPGKRLQLVWGRGVSSPRGITNSKDQILAFRTEERFEARFYCQRERKEAPCLPISDMSLGFSAPIPWKIAEKVVLKLGNTVFHPANGNSSTEAHEVRFKGPFPANAKFSLEIPSGIKDDQGRSLANQAKFPLTVTTGTYPPLAKFASAFGILEESDPVLPVTLRNVESNIGAYKLEGARISLAPGNPAKVLQWIQRLKQKQENYLRYEGEKVFDSRGESLLYGESAKEKFSFPKPNGSDLEVVGIPLGRKGFHVVEIESRILGASLLGASKNMYVASGALVTNLAVHFKWGRERSLIWVTSLSNGKPVPGAKLRVENCNGGVVWEGVTDKSGTALTDSLPKDEDSPRCEPGRAFFQGGLVVEAEKGGDFSIVYSGWDNGIENWRFQLPFVSGENQLAHTVFDRTLLRAGQTVHMKHFLRQPYLKGIRFRNVNMPKSMVIEHSSGKRVFLPVSFDSQGMAEAEWKIPREAELGSYSVYLSPHGIDPSAEGEKFETWRSDTISTGSFQVQEFRLPVMAGSLQWARPYFTGAEPVSADLHVKFLAGGAASGLPVKIRARMQKREGASFPDFDGVLFANGGIRMGRFRRSDRISEDDRAEKKFPDQRINLDTGGSGRVSVSGLPAWDHASRFELEGEYRDPNGEIQTVHRSSNIYPSRVLLGIQPAGWAAQAEKVQFKVAAVSPDGKAVAGQPMKVSWIQKQTFSHRKRIVGGFYAYENFEEFRERGEACSGKTNEKGILECEVKAPVTGAVLLQAETQFEGKISRCHHEIYVAGSEDWWFSQENDDRIDLLPEKKNYEPGETARFQVRSPFREATALVTVEREGVIESFVREISGKNPVIEVPIRDSFAPNVFVSALLVRGRVGEPKPTALLDLGRPSHKLGIAKIRVAWKAHRLKVLVQSDRQDYRVREKVKVKVKVERELDAMPAAKGEVLLLAVDESLLELKKNDSWNLLDSMMAERPLSVQSSTAQSQVIGKRHYGLKALPPGGGGGLSNIRELFDTLLVWKARLPLNEKGEVEAEVPLNDSLSSFRIVAIATEGSDRFGTGFETVRTRQDLMLFSGLSPLARHGDQIHPEVTVRNAGTRELAAKVQGRVNGRELGEKKVNLAPGESKVVSWSLRVPMSGEDWAYEFEARSDDAIDKLRISQKLEPSLRESVVQGTLERLEGNIRFPVEKPRNSLPSVGGVSVRLEKSLAANLGGVRSYMQVYPYTCLEQKVSKSIVLRDESLWNQIMATLPSYMDSSGLLKYFPEALYGSDTLTSYFLSIASESGYTVPQEVLVKIVGGLQNFVSGKSYYAGFQYPAADLSIRKIAAMEALSRFGGFDPAYLGLIQIQPDLWPMRAVLDWASLLKREKRIPGRETFFKEALKILRSKIEWRGSVLGFKGGMKIWWLMNSMDEDANRLLLLAVEDESWKDEVGRLVRGVLARTQGGHWDLTTANAWGILAMERFSKKFEKDPVDGVSTVSFEGQKKNLKWKSAETMAAGFSWPKSKTELSLTHSGAGNPWALIEGRAALVLDAPIFKGYRITRKLIPVEQKLKGKWSVGDVYRVSLEIEAPSDMTWVVLADPVPAGASVLGSELGNDSELLTRGEKRKGWSYGYEERSFSGFRSYFEWLPKGTHKLEYTVRLNTSGTFSMPNTRVEAMYAPEMYAETPNDSMVVLSR